MEYFESESQPSKGTIESFPSNQLTSPSYMSIYGTPGTALAAICPLSAGVFRPCSLPPRSRVRRSPPNPSLHRLVRPTHSALCLKRGAQSKID